MLELDLRLVPFIEQQFSNLPPDEVEAYEELLEKEDWQIYDWLRGVGAPNNGRLELIVEKIIAFSLATSKI
jgi:succinate dehydrogenase flavin-adding protein (antitoxin of CptAB toxin-antitoxin module)